MNIGLRGTTFTSRVNVCVNFFSEHPMSHLPVPNAFFAGKILSSRVYPEFFPLRKTDRVLNAGFGDGPQAIVYAGSFAQMTGVDIQADRLARAREFLEQAGVQGVELREGNVETLPVPDASFDAALAIDIIEHVEHPERLTAELFRALTPGGRLLITFPAMHDRFEDAVSVLGKIVKPWKVRTPKGSEWHPDQHAHEYPIKQWRTLVERAGFSFVRSRATTMFPPLHLYGVPRFWFSNPVIHAIDRAVASFPVVQNSGQTVMVEFVKPST